MGSTIQDLYYQKSKGSFTEKFHVPFMYCQVNESVVRAQKNDHYNAHVWYRSRNDQNRVIPDQITEGEEIFVPQSDVKYFEENINRIFGQVKDLKKDSIDSTCSLVLYHNMSSDQYGLVFFSKTKI